MRLLLLHGGAKSVSRKKLIEIKGKFDPNNVVVFEEGVDISEILGSLATLPLLSEDRLIIAENPPEDFCPDLSLISDQISLIFWFDHEISEKKKVLEWVKKGKGEVLNFPEGREISIFPFLDYLASADKKAFLEIKKLEAGGFDIFYFITMTFYLLRNLVNTPKGAPQFVKDKLQRQRKNFDLAKITSLYQEILEIEYKLKSGLLEVSQAEFKLVNKFLTN